MPMPMTFSLPFVLLALALTLSSEPGMAAEPSARPAVAPTAERPADKPAPINDLEIDKIAPAPAQFSIEEELKLGRRAILIHDPADALSHYLRVLTRDPDNVEALIAAGKASLEIGDPGAAINFLARAEQASPRNGSIKAGLGSAMVQMIQPQPALRLFDEAVRLGVPAADIAADRGLAWDLRGDPKRARADYELALTTRQDPETVRRLALSIAIAGDPLAALATLDALLEKQDKAAWRARAFVLAISGDVVGAAETARAALLPAQAAALRPFLVRIAQLKPSQKAAAVHFGRFPSEGRTYSEAELLAAAGMTLPATAPAPATSGDKAPAAPMADNRGAPIVPPLARPVRSVSSLPIATRSVSPATSPSSTMAGADRPPTETAKATERKRVTPAKEPDARTSTDSREWVQIAMGRYRPDLDKDWARLKGKYPDLLAGWSPMAAVVDQSNRLLVGPFKTADAAQAFVNKAAAGGLVTTRFVNRGDQKIERIE